MISSACEQAETRALKVHTSVTSKRRRMHLHTKTVDETTAEKDIQQQVEQLKLYQDNKEEGETETSSSSSEGSSWKGCPEETLEQLYDLNNLEFSYSLRDLLVGKYPLTKNAEQMFSVL